jgi:hypothetical protein
LSIESVTVPIYENNKGAVDLAGNPVYHKRVKHIEIRYHAIREKVADGTVILLKIPTRANFADMHTKAVSKVVFDILSPFIVSRIENLWYYHGYYYSNDIFMIHIISLILDVVCDKTRERYCIDLDDMSQVSFMCSSNKGGRVLT